MHESLIASLPALFLRGLIRFYQLAISPLLTPSCRFQPSCSEYARQAISRHGAARGAWLAGLRILRCHPWGRSGWDPVPEQLPQSETTSRCHHG